VWLGKRGALNADSPATGADKSANLGSERVNTRGMPPLPRSSGVQLHITSLPDGRLGASAYRFVDWLAQAGQTWWQVLPLGPPDRHHSPYKARSAFAAWPGLLADRRAPVSADERIEFVERNAFWTEDWARFAGRGAINDQVRFDREWGALRRYAAERGVKLFGDVAIYVAPGSVDHRAYPQLFQDGFVAGAPPDAFAPGGQLWGNPLYDWPALRSRRYRWWVERMRRTLELFDLARIDHFRGFVAYWAVPEGARSAAHGKWKRGPGRALFDAMRAELGDVPLVAEDLGVITDPVRRLRDELGLPGMLVIQFGFEPDEPDSPHRLENHVKNAIVYTGTHDHDTLVGWHSSLDPERRRAVDAAASSFGRGQWGLIGLTMSSRAQVAMVQAQDVLGLGSEARMNDPRRASGSWSWRLEPGALTKRLAGRLREATAEAGRL
jgi:4-alpha-glucanotransferase